MNTIVIIPPSVRGGGDLDGWLEIQPAGDADKNWQCIASADDGETIFAGVNAGRIYKSTNGGTSFSEIQPDGNADFPWYSIAVDSDASHILLGRYKTDGAYHARISADSGANWANGHTTGRPMRCSVDSDGSVMAWTNGYGPSGTYLGYFSTNSGANWTAMNTSNYNFERPVCSVSRTDGSVIQTTYYGDGAVMYSTNFGASWATGTYKGSNPPQTLAMSSDGGVTLVGYYNERLYLSDDYTVNLTEVRPAGNAAFYWRCSAMSGDGSVMMASIDAKRLYMSIDSGVNWTEEMPAGDADKGWRDLYITPDGKTLLAACYGGRLWKRTLP
jgi:photosystem II stability/assembly factor-like uncharacterized protein